MVSINYSISPLFNKGHDYFTLKPKYFMTTTGFFGIFTPDFNLGPFGLLDVQHGMLTNHVTDNLAPFRLLDP